jgi:hypothetical protein
MQAGIVENESRHRFSPENNAKDIHLGEAQLKKFYRFDAKELTPRSLMVAVTFRPFRHYRSRSRIRFFRQLYLRFIIP